MNGYGELRIFQPRRTDNLHPTALPYVSRAVIVRSWHDNVAMREAYPNDERVGFVQGMFLDIPESELIKPTVRRRWLEPQLTDMGDAPADLLDLADEQKFEAEVEADLTEYYLSFALFSCSPRPAVLNVQSYVTRLHEGDKTPSKAPGEHQYLASVKATTPKLAVAKYLAEGHPEYDLEDIYPGLKLIHAFESGDRWTIEYNLPRK